MSKNVVVVILMRGYRAGNSSSPGFGTGSCPNTHTIPIFSSVFPLGILSLLNNKFSPNFLCFSSLAFYRPFGTKSNDFFEAIKEILDSREYRKPGKLGTKES